MQNIVICGAGFLGSHISKAFATGSATGANGLQRKIRLASRNPTSIHQTLQQELPPDTLLPPVRVDITEPSTLTPAFADADVVVSLVGIMHGSPGDFERIQWKGAQNVAQAAKTAGAKLVHVSAIGADENSAIPYARTKALGEKAVFEECPDATVIRPSLVFGPGDGFYARFAKLSSFLPFMPVFGGGTARFQPVFVGDLARAIEIIARREDEAVAKMADGKIIEAGGPEVFTYREIMEQVLRYTGRTRPIISLPFAVGMLQGAVLERLPVNLLTVTRAQVEQLKSDNVAADNSERFKDILAHGHESLNSVHDVLPTYLN